jgi:hypothetical protein
MRTGQVEIRRDATSLNLGIVARAAQRTFEAAQEISSRRSLILQNWRLVESIRHMRRQVSQRVAKVIRVIRARTELRIKEQVVVRDWDVSR